MENLEVYLEKNYESKVISRNKEPKPCHVHSKVIQYRLCQVHSKFIQYQYMNT